MMSDELDHMLTKYSLVNCTHFFAHILNLVTKSLLKQLNMKQDDKKDDLTDNEQPVVLPQLEPMFLVIK
jgi:hypothetical protein